MTQPIGAFPFPAGLMLVPDEELGSQATIALLGGRIPERWPDALEPQRLAHAGEHDRALAQIGAAADPVSRFNRWLLDPDSEPRADVAAGLPASLAPLVDVVAYMNGDDDTPPAERGETDVVVAALVASAHASAALAAGDAARASELLFAASAGCADAAPGLSAVLAAGAATTVHESGADPAVARGELERARVTLADTDLDVTRAEVELTLGGLEHERAAATGDPLRGAMNHYMTALQLVTREQAPYLWASAQLNLATAQLSSPMAEASDQLRTGIAIAALRAALEVFTPESYPQQWAVTTLNLANALVYAPSAKQGDNLVEAVELYEQVLEARDRDSDPLGRARVLANQGNALAHLGIFDQAKAKLFEARFLFEEALDHDSALTVRGVLDEIVKATAAQNDPDAADGSGRMAMGGVGPQTRDLAQEARDGTNGGVDGPAQQTTV